MIPVYVPEDWHPVLKELAAAQGESLTAWIRGLAFDQIPKKKRKELSEPARRGNPTFGKKREAGDE